MLPFTTVLWVEEELKAAAFPTLGLLSGQILIPVHRFSSPEVRQERIEEMRIIDLTECDGDGGRMRRQLWRVKQDSEKDAECFAARNKLYLCPLK